MADSARDELVRLMEKHQPLSEYAEKLADAIVANPDVVMRALGAEWQGSCFHDGTHYAEWHIEVKDQG